LAAAGIVVVVVVVLPRWCAGLVAFADDGGLDGRAAVELAPSAVV
jgi:hypothetical protein